jgi:hypothetical protein
MARSRSAAWWRAAITTWKESGEGVRAYCSRRGIPPSTFYWWRKRIAEDSDSRPRFVSVRMTELTVSAGGPAGIEVLLRNGRRLRLDRGFDAATLQAAIETLEAIAC